LHEELSLVRALQVSEQLVLRTRLGKDDWGRDIGGIMDNSFEVVPDVQVVEVVVVVVVEVAQVVVVVVEAVVRVFFFNVVGEAGVRVIFFATLDVDSFVAAADLSRIVS
jgi:hypothetical protein